LEVHAPRNVLTDCREWNITGARKTNPSAWSESIRWEAGNLPALRREDGLPALRTLLPSVALSSERSYSTMSWTAYAKTLRNAIEPLVQPSKQIREHARKIAAPFKTREEKIKALRDDVLKNIRLAGPSFTELPLSTLSAPEKTLARGYGHALDRMILLDAMLRAEGFATEMIFAESRKSTKGERPWSLQHVPQRNEFIQPLIAVLPERSLWDRLWGNYPYPADKIHIGDGDQYTPLGVTAFDDFMGLNITLGDRCHIYVRPEFRAQTRSNTVIDLQPNGDAIITYTNWYYGAACAVFRKQYIEQPPEERRREHLELINGFSRGAVPLSPLVTETEAYPGYMAFTLRAPRYAALGENTMTVLLPTPTVLPLPLRSDRRFNPMLAPKINSDEKTVRVILPEEFTQRVITPSRLAFSLDSPYFTSEPLYRGWGNLSQHTDKTKVNGRATLDFTYQLNMDDVLIMPTIYPVLLESNRRLTHPSQRTLILMRE